VSEGQIRNQGGSPTSNAALGSSASTVNGAGKHANGAARARPHANGNGRRLAYTNGGGAQAITVHGAAAALPAAEAERAPRAPVTPIPLRQPTRITPSSIRDAVFRRTLALADLLAAAGGLVAISIVTGRTIAVVSLATLPLIVLLAKVSGRYDHDEMVLRKSTLDEAPSLMMLAAAYALAWSFVVFFAGVHPDPGGAGAAALWATTGVLLVTARTGARALSQLSAPPERVLIVGDSVARTRLAQSIGCDPGAHIEVVGFLPLEDERRVMADWGPNSRRKRTLAFDDVGNVARELNVHRVFLIPTTADSETMLDAVRRTTALGVKVSIVPRLFEVVGSAVEFDTIGGVTVLGVRRPGLSRSSWALKRTMDVLGSAIGLVLLAPLGLAIAIAIKLDSAGPVFFRQLRVGRNGETFRMFKFRSMYDGAEAQRAALETLNETDGLFKVTADPRVTRVGRLLRKTSIDELPQLINVLLGNMSLVGPRPLVVDEDRLVEGRHRDRLQLPPGMTGPWQVLGPSRPPLSEMVKTDYLYAANWSLWTDVKILMRTFAHVLAQRGL
jgi:exopolysaccharide biosynthesis polyprenyl glycosylphosphotransferase